MIIALTCFNRLHTLKNTVVSLMECKGIENVPIYYFCDYGDNVKDVRAFVRVTRRGIDKIKFREVHHGLCMNTEQGIKEAFSFDDKIIWLQDDMEFSKDFLEFMRYALDEYENDSEIMYVSGYSPVLHHSLYLSPYVGEALGLWKDKFDYELLNIDYSVQVWLEDYRQFAGDKFYDMLINSKKKDVISIYLSYAMFRSGSYCLHPNRNKLRHLVSDSINSKATDVKFLNQNLYEGFSRRIDSGIMPISYLKNYSPVKRLTRWVSRELSAKF